MTASEQTWQPSTPDLILSDQTIHVWRTSLAQPPALIQQLTSLLSPTEQARATRFHFERDQRRFIVARAGLRILLGRYADVEPSQVRFRYGPYDKPYFLHGPHRPALQFNLAHSHELALYVFTRQGEVGIDLEFIHPLPEAEQIASRFFSPSENATFQALPEDQKLEAFFNCWTRKEAYIKALGEGLSHPLNQFQVSLIPGQPAQLLKVESFPEEAKRWRMLSFVPAAGYVAALVAEGSTSQVEYGQLELTNDPGM